MLLGKSGLFFDRFHETRFLLVEISHGNCMGLASLRCLDVNSASSSLKAILCPSTCSLGNAPTCSHSGPTSSWGTWSSLFVHMPVVLPTVSSLEAGTIWLICPSQRLPRAWHIAATSQMLVESKSKQWLLDGSQPWRSCMHRLIKSYKPAVQFLLLPTFQIRQTGAQEAKVGPGVQLRCPFPSHLFASSPKVADGGSQQLRAFVDPSQHRRVFRSCLLFCFERTPAGWSRGDNNCLDFLRSLLGEAAWSQGRKEAAGPQGQCSNPDSVTACVALARCSTALRLLQRDKHTSCLGAKSPSEVSSRGVSALWVLCVCGSCFSVKMLESADVTASVALADPVLWL